MTQTDRTFGNNPPYSLTGYINLLSINPLINAIANTSREERGVRYLLDASQVTDFSSLALLEICMLRKNLKEKDSDILLTHCNAHVRNFMFVPLFQSLVV